MLNVRHTLINGNLYKPKTLSSICEIKLLNKAYDAIVAQKNLNIDSEFIFNNPNTDRNWYSTDILRKHWVKLFDKINVKYRNPYQMRHSFVSMLIGNGENTYRVAQYLGHKNPEMVITYCKYIPKDDFTGDKFRAKYDD